MDIIDVSRKALVMDKTEMMRLHRLMEVCYSHSSKLTNDEVKFLNYMLSVTNRMMMEG